MSQHSGKGHGGRNLKTSEKVLGHSKAAAATWSIHLLSYSVHQHRADDPRGG